MSQPPRILSVGQCGVDTARIGRFLRDTFRARADTADTATEALDRLRAETYDAVLVNRVLDLDGSPGLALILAIKADPALAPTPTLLVSNYPDAQAEAVALGALPGFGKADLGKKAAEALSTVLGLAEAR